LERQRSAILVFVSCWRNFFSRPGAFTIKAARSIHHQIIVAPQSALDIERRACRRVGIGTARGQDTH